MKSVKSFISIFLLLSCVSCGPRSGTSTGTPLVSFAINGSSQNATVARFFKRSPFYEIFFPIANATPPASLRDSQGAIITLNQFWTTTGSIEFKSNESKSTDEVDGSEASFEGPFTVDLLQSDVSNFGPANIPTSTIRRVKIRLRRTAAASAGAPTGLTGESIYISGTVSGHSFVFVTRDEPTLEISGANSVITSNGDTLLLQIQTANFFRQIDLSSIATSVSISESNRVSTNGSACPRINMSASDLYTCFHDSFAAAANLGRDKGSHELLPDDSTLK